MSYKIEYMESIAKIQRLWRARMVKRAKYVYDPDGRLARLGMVKDGIATLWYTMYVDNPEEERKVPIEQCLRSMYICS